MLPGAKGSSTSDIDLVVILDRLDTEQFSTLRLEEERELARMAGEVCVCPVKVWLVDWSEWRSRFPALGNGGARSPHRREMAET